MNGSGLRETTDTARLEAFSDGVFAIAITLLILDVGPAEGEGSLAHRLLDAWPSGASFLVSFLIIGTMWLNHHRMFALIRAAGHATVVANLFLLLVVTFIPFPTKLVGEELADGTFADQRTAVLLYGFTFIAVSIAFPVLWRTAARRRGDLVDGVTEAVVRAKRRQMQFGFPTFSLATLVALLSPTLSLALFGLVSLFYLLPSEVIERRL